MGCASSNEAPPDNVKTTKKAKFNKSHLKNTNLDIKKSRSPSINSRNSQKVSPPSNLKSTVRSSSLKNLKAPTNQGQKTTKKQIQKSPSDLNIKKSQKNLEISQSKIKLEVKQIVDENQEDMGLPSKSQRKLRKTKKKKAGDPRMGQMVKIYGF